MARIRDETTRKAVVPTKKAPSGKKRARGTAAAAKPVVATAPAAGPAGQGVAIRPEDDLGIDRPGERSDLGLRPPYFP